MTPDEKRIVEWLRKLKDGMKERADKQPRLDVKVQNKGTAIHLGLIADAIQNGDHRKDKL